jgi:hypothetical protein
MSTREILVREELERLLKSSSLRRAANHQRLLQYLVERAV